MQKTLTLLVVIVGIVVLISGINLTFAQSNTLAPSVIPTLTPVPSATPTPAITPIPRECSTKVFGDADCDGQTTADDYKYWLCEFIEGGVCKDINSGRWSDFFRDGKVDMVDFEVYRRNFYK